MTTSIKCRDCGREIGTGTLAGAFYRPHRCPRTGIWTPSGRHLLWMFRDVRSGDRDVPDCWVIEEIKSVERTARTEGLRYAAERIATLEAARCPDPDAHRPMLRRLVGRLRRRDNDEASGPPAGGSTAGPTGGPAAGRTSEPTGGPAGGSTAGRTGRPAGVSTGGPAGGPATGGPMNRAIARSSRRPSSHPDPRRSPGPSGRSP
ncbi:MAG TPA: hypothetical protein VNJ28_02380 [Candidatus Limnocylindrales bacterium]|nr:hypothetical protein [Candidatus Limnocylindrales bacterium]